MIKKGIKLLLSICTVFTLFTIQSVQAEEETINANTNENTSGYKQLMSDAKINSGFEFANGINTSVNFSEVAVFTDTNAKVNGTKRGIEKDKTVTVKIPNGFKYMDGSVYDIYVDITPDKTLSSESIWMCKRVDSGNYHCLELSPFNMSGWGSDPYVGFSYKLKLVDPNNDDANVVKEKGIDLTAGSCWTARNEGARPFGTNNTIYTNIPKQYLQWEKEITANGTKYEVNCWHITNDAYNKLNYYILGSGTNEDGSIQGGYIRSTVQGGSAEMMLGYFKNFTGDNYVGYYDGKSHSINVAGDDDKAIVTYYTDDTYETECSQPYYKDVKYNEDGSVGSYTVYYKVSGEGYNENPQGQTGTVTIKPLPVVIDTKAQDKVYDGTKTATINNVSNHSTGVGSEAVNITNLTGEFTDKNVAKNISITLDSEYTINPANSSTNLKNYTFIVNAPKASITKKDVYVYPNALDKTYDGNTTATIVGDDKSTANSESNPISTVGCVDGESLSVYGLTGTFDNAAAGNNKKVTVSDKDNPSIKEGNNTKKENYTIHIYDTYASINKATQNGATVLAYVGVYDGQYHNITVTTTYDSTITYYKDKDCKTELKTNDSTFGGYKDVDTTEDMYTIYFKVVDNNTNYADYIGESFVMIVPRPVTLSPIANDKVYDGNTDATINQLSNVSTSVGNEAVNVTNLTGEFASKDVADDINVKIDSKYDITPVGETKKSNYSFTMENPTASITPKVIKVIPAAENKTYDGTLTATVKNVENMSTGVKNETISITNLEGTFDTKDAGVNKTVVIKSSNSTITAGTGTNLNNYDIRIFDTTANIYKKDITIKPTANDKTYDGKVDAVINSVENSKTGVKDESISITGLTGEFVDKNVGENKTVKITNTGIVTPADDTNLSNYNITVENPTASITKKSVDVYPQAQSKEYDSNKTAIIFGDNLTNENSLSNPITVVGCIEGESLSVYGLTGEFQSAEVGNNKEVTVSKNNYSVKEGKNTSKDNYEITIHDTKASIWQKGQSGLQVSAYVGVYDGQSHNIKVTGDYVDSVKFYSDANHTTEITGYTNVGTYTVYYEAKDVDSKNYANQSGESFVMIVPKPIEVPTTAQDKIYDGTITATVNDVTNFSTGVGNESISFIGFTGTFSDKNVGTDKAITLTNTDSVTKTPAEGTSLDNYTITYKNPTAAITPKEIEITPSADDKVYDSTTSVTIHDVLNYSTGINDEAITVRNITGEFDSKDVNNDIQVTIRDKQVVSASSSTDLNNYTVTVLNPTANITPKQIIVSTTTQDKIYDGSTTATVSNVNDYSTGVGSESISFSNFTGTFSDKNVGNDKTVELTNTDSITKTPSKGTNLSNYEITYKNPTASITPKDVYVNPVAESRAYSQGNITATIYGDKDELSANGSENTISVTGCIDNESLSVYGLTGTFNNDEVGNDKDVTVNTNNMSVIEGENTSKSNYNIIVNNTHASIWPVDQNGLQVSAYVGVYDGQSHNIKVKGQYVSNVKFYEDEAHTKEITGYTNVGTYTVYYDATDINENYYNKSGSSFVMIVPRPIEVPTKAQDKVYDGTDTATVNNVNNFATGVGSESISFTNFTGTFSDKNVGTNKTVTVNTDSVTKTPSEGTNLSNYEITYKNTTASITKKLVEITPVADSKVYDGNTNAIVNEVKDYSTGIDGEAINVTNIFGSFVDANAHDNITVNLNSGYNVATANSSTSLDNYEVHVLNPSASITPKPITVTAKDQVIDLGGSIKTGDDAYTIQEGVLVGGDTLGEFSVYADGEYDHVDIYKDKLKVRGTATNTNYDITYIDGKLTVRSDDYYIFKNVEDTSSTFTNATMSNTVDQLYNDSDTIFTKDDKSKFTNGTYHYGVVWLEITDTDLTKIPSNSQEEIKQLAIKEVGENPYLYYFDANMYKQIDNNDPVSIKDTTEDIVITVTVPSELINTDNSMVRKYKIITYHDDTVTTLDTYFNEEQQTITFKTSKFSTFALAYADTKKNTTVDCESEKGKNYTWSESKQACVYKVTNTSNQ